MSKINAAVKIVDIEGRMFYEKDSNEVDVWAKEGIPVELTFTNQGRQYLKLKAAAQKSADDPVCRVRIVIEQIIEELTCKKRKLKPEGYKCPFCGAIFPKPESLGGHVTAKHTEADLDLILLQKGYKKKGEEKETKP